MEGTVHSFSIEERKAISATAIDSVDAFSPTQIVLSYAGGKITVVGNGLKIVGFSKTSGSFSAVGTVTGVRYMTKGLKITQKIFK